MRRRQEEERRRGRWRNGERTEERDERRTEKDGWREEGKRKDDRKREKERKEGEEQMGAERMWRGKGEKGFSYFSFSLTLALAPLTPRSYPREGLYKLRWDAEGGSA